MVKGSESTAIQQSEEVKILASRLMHLHYCDRDFNSVAELFAPQFTWIGAGEEQYIAGRDNAVEAFSGFEGAIPECVIWDEEYEAIELERGIYVVSGRMWIATAPGVEMYLKVHQRVTFVFKEFEEGLLCSHIHCSNPYQEMIGGEAFPDKIGKQSYDYVQERLKVLEAETIQQNRQLEVIMSSIAGGLKISNDDDTYSFAFVSKEAAALFGYTVEEFMEVTGGTAVGAVYPPDLEHALADCEEAFRDGGLSYATRYRIRCKDGSLKWIIDSGKKAQDSEGNWMVNSLYLDVTQAENDAQRLREQTQLLNSIYNSIPCGIIRFVHGHNGEYRLISINRAALSLLGYSSREEGMKDWNGGVMGNVLEEDQDMLRQTYNMLHEEGDRQDREYRARWRDGSLHWLECTNMIVDFTESGEAVIQRTIIDITERKTLQQQLDREQEMYRVAMESSSDVMFEYLMDEDRFIAYEPQPGQGVIQREIPGYTHVLAQGVIIHPEDVQIVVDNICNGRAEMFEVRLQRPESDVGDYRWHRVSGRLIADGHRPGRVVGTIRNIHSMKETLSENSERLHMSQSALQAISGVFVSIFYVDLNKDQYYAVRLPQAGDSMEFPRVGKYSADLCSRLLYYTEEDKREKMAELCGRERLLGQFSDISGDMQMEFRQDAKDGLSTSWLRLEIQPINIENSDIRTAIITLRNVSEEKKLELEYREEERAAKRALEEAYEGARHANLSKSEFLSRMSHDIRTPMNAIMGMATIAENYLDNREKLMDCLGKIHVSGQHLLGLINEVLDMSKIESGNVSLAENRFYFSDMVHTVEQIMRPDMEAKEQQLTVKIDIKNDLVYGDTMRVQQILLNLLSNAMKYTQDGGYITLSAAEKTSARNGVGCFEIVVEDNGIGMPPEFLDNLFVPFERAEDSRVAQVQGTGLGMAITSNLVQMMNGTIEVESKIDCGSKFRVTIFLKLVGEEKPAQEETEWNSSTKKTEFKPDTCILLVEDNDINREIAQELLGIAGLQTVCASDGKEAVERFRDNPPGTYSLILMDIQMPVMNGYEASMAIRKMGQDGKRPDASDIPIIALTANAFADDAYRSRQAGMNEHVAKPLDIKRLLEVLRHWID